MLSFKRLALQRPDAMQGCSLENTEWGNELSPPSAQGSTVRKGVSGSEGKGASHDTTRIVEITASHKS